MIWNPEYESMTRADMETLQLRRLRSVVAWVYDRVPYYRSLLDETGVRPESVRSLQDLRRLPLTDKTTLRDTYPFGLFAVPLDQVVRIHSSSGTTGKPIVVGYTRGDTNTWTELTARVVSAAGVSAADRAQMAFGYSMFTGGFGMHYGLERVGATVIPAGAGNTERHLMMIRDFGTTVLIATPSYALYLAEEAAKEGFDLRSSTLRVGLFGAEPSGEGMRREIEERLGIVATDNYGLSEVGGPGVSGECECRCGLHIAEDHFLAEIVHPETLEPLPAGEEGELVLTPLTKEAFPVMRYRTRDLTALEYEPCACGRTTVRMRKVRKRTDDMMIIRGVNVFPSQIEDVLLKIEGVRPHYLIIVDRERAMDDLAIEIEVDEAFFSDSMVDLVHFTREVADRLHAVLGLHARVKLVEHGTIERTAGKSRRVVDHRAQD